MRRITAAHLRPVNARTALAALAIAATAAAPVVAFAETIPLPKTTVSADPNDPPIPDPSGGYTPYAPQNVDNFDYTSITGDGGGGGGG
jgi:hypothetical protein